MTPPERLNAITRPLKLQVLDVFLITDYSALSRENVSTDEAARMPEDLAQVEKERAP